MTDPRTRRRTPFLLSLMTLTTLAFTAKTAAQIEPAVQSGFPVTLSGSNVRSGSIALGDLNNDGVLDIVVGGIDGKVYAYTGTGGFLWEFDTGEMGVEGKAAIGDVDGDDFNEVVIGAGSPVTPNAHGGLFVLDHLGGLQCEFQTEDDNDPDTFREGVFSSPSLADLDGNDGGLLEIAFGAYDRHVRAINHDCSVVWDNDVIDTVTGSTAIGDIDRDGQLDVVIGVFSSSMPAPNGEEDGGLLHVYDGATGAELPGFPIQIDETIDSSPALGDINNDGFLEIVVGTGFCWANPACAPLPFHPNVGEYLNAWDHNGDALPGWPVAIPGTFASASPALADLDGNGALDVIINTIDPDNTQLGRVYALDASGTALPGWPTRPTTPTNGMGGTQNTSTGASPIIADVTGDSGLEVLLPSSFEIVIWDADGDQLTRDALPLDPGDLNLGTLFSISGGAAVGDIDGDGDLEVVVGGAETGGSPGAIYAWDLDGTATTEALAWPMFRRSSDNQAALSGLIFADGFESGDLTAW